MGLFTPVKYEFSILKIIFLFIYGVIQSVIAMFMPNMN